MGERIVAQLGLEDAVDTLARWMSHRLAELIQQAESGDEQARQEATDLILRLWSHRSDWPHGWPPAETEKVRRWLETPAFPERPQQRDPTAPWLSRLPDLKRLHHEEYEIWLRLALAEADLDKDVADSEELEENLEERELSYLRMLALNRQSALEHFAEHLKDEDSPLARARLARRELDDVETRRRQLFEEVLDEHESSSQDEEA